MVVDPPGPFRRDRRSCPAQRDGDMPVGRRASSRNLWRRSGPRCRESVPVDAFQRLRTADCHGRGLYGPVDASTFSELRKKLENFPTFSDRVTIIHLPPTRALTTTKSRYGCSRSVCGDTSPNQHSRRCVRWAYKEI